MKDTTVAHLVAQEELRQKSVIRLIASENYVSPQVQEVSSSVIQNKYSEGYPHRRYYQGQDWADKIEDLAIERACSLFNAEHANVQPYSGSPANLAVYYALLEVGDTVMGMGLPAGGHLTHGWGANFSGRFYDAHLYGLNKETERLDYDEIRRMAQELKPKMIIAGASAYPREIDFSIFGEIAKEVGAYLVADIAHISGLVATGNHPHPFPHADVVTTTTHKTLRGPRGGLILCKKELAKAIDRAVFPSLQGGPHMQAVAAKAVAFYEASQDSFQDYAKQVISNAQTLATELEKKGMRIITGGTDNHIVLADVTGLGTTGGAAAKTLESAGIVVNANSIPFDTRGPFDPSGIRIGTSAVTTRGMEEEDMVKIASYIHKALMMEDSSPLKEEVSAFARSFPTFCP